MEASSPLAAMQPPSLMPWHCRDMYSSRSNSNLSASNSFGPGAFNFRDLSMKRPAPEYFSLKTIRGSSPTTSLAADLSQNFHIDMSPQLPTPRRSLFTANIFGTLDSHESVTTPPLHSSSPGSFYESMDMSPLPHKAPYSVQIEAQSPCPPQTSEHEMNLRSSPPRPNVAELPKAPPFMPERRKSVLLRPGLSRTKGHSAGAVPQRSRPEVQLPPFRFGAGSSKLSTSTSMSLGECFMESPPQEKRMAPSNNPAISAIPPPRTKQSSLSISVVRNGSPISHARRPSNPLFRPRKQFRRSLSMFENPADIMTQKKEQPPTCASTALQSVMDVDEHHQPVLPHFFPEGQPDSIPRITKNTLVEILEGKFDNNYKKRMVIDCRFEYEYNGGHINGAVNYNDKEMLTGELFANTTENTLLIFHCEYSAHRAPIMARHVRQQDRTTNIEHYPRLTYPEVYILDGGYSAFFSDHRDRCYPQNYVEMDAKEHAFTCEREMGRLRQNRGKLGRAQTFAFGQHGGVEDSPTGPSRSGRAFDTMMLDSSPIPNDNRVHGRRLASY
ncbi:hypothetical protein V493_04361 [Pseudogymnoascus sp. VKM F-4281 (FW-2241)]|nr:hypothetical protein V493_04361 [Pseudogymnoascus sp. VKM F-4281 (FW-2241)]